MPDVTPTLGALYEVADMLEYPAFKDWLCT